MPACRAVAVVLLPFASGYYLSYLIRTINALTAERLAADLHLGAADLGLLTSAYFFTFHAVPAARPRNLGERLGPASFAA